MTPTNESWDAWIFKNILEGELICPWNYLFNSKIARVANVLFFVPWAVSAGVFWLFTFVLMMVFFIIGTPIEAAFKYIVKGKPY